jgi:hypothetical protein
MNKNQQPVPTNTLTDRALREIEKRAGEIHGSGELHIVFDERGRLVKIVVIESEHYPISDDEDDDIS